MSDCPSFLAWGGFCGCSEFPRRVTPLAADPLTSHCGHLLWELNITYWVCCDYLLHACSPNRRTDIYFDVPKTRFAAFIYYLYVEAACHRLCLFRFSRHDSFAACMGTPGAALMSSSSLGKKTPCPTGPSWNYCTM